MTVSSTTNKVSLSGNGTQDTFAYTFKIFEDGDLDVYIRDDEGTETLKTITTHYTVTGAGNEAGGNVVFTGGNIPASTEDVIIQRKLDLTQGTDYVENDPFPAESHEEALDRLTMIAQQMQEEIDRSIKASVTNTFTNSEFTVDSTDRANKVFAFDSDGDLSITQELGTYRGDWAASRAYNERDLVKDTSTNNIFLANTAHTSSGAQPLTTNTDSAKWDLIVDAASAAASSTSASGFADEAENWARKTDGEAVSGEGYSSKAWAIGGTGVTDTASSGAAKEWATKAEDSTVDGSGYSALHHAAKASASATAASNSETNAQSSEDEAEAWAQKTDGEAVTGEGYSSKAWATGGTGVTDTAGSGSAKEWATDTTNTCDGTEYSAKEYAIGTQSGNTNGSAKQWAIGGGTGFDRDTAVSGGEYSAKYWANQAANSAQSQRDVYYGAFTTDAAAETYQTGTNGGTVDEGDIYFNSTSNRLRVYDGTNWNDAVVDTTGFATAGFSIAMAIAL